MCRNKPQHSKCCFIGLEIYLKVVMEKDNHFLRSSTNQFDFIQHDFIKETSTKGNITKVDM